MAISGTNFPECCRYCPHRTSVTGSCDHEARQTLMQAFVTTDSGEQTCPIYDDFRAEEMAQLSERLDSASEAPSEQ